jgi:hypothetical protein
VTQLTSLKASEILTQSWEMLVPKGRWVKEEWIRLEQNKQGERLYSVCSMGALLLVEHLAGVSGLGLASERDSDDADSEDHGSVEMDDFEGTINELMGRDGQFKLAVSFLAEAVRTYVSDPTNLRPVSDDETLEAYGYEVDPWDKDYLISCIDAGGLVEAITHFNDCYYTKDADIDKVFQAAYRNAQAAESA